MAQPIVLAFKEEGLNDTVRAMGKVGESSRDMAAQIDRSADSQKLLSARIGDSEGRFMGMADLLDGIGTAFGLPIDGAINMARAAGDVTGGLSNLSGIIPATMAKFPQLAGAMTMVSAHPLMTAFLVGGAIIAGLILLEKKFGVVSGAVEALGGAFSWVWNNAIKPSINGILGGAETLVNGLASIFNAGLGRLPGVPNIGRVSLPRLDVGGTVLQTGIAVVHRGETINRAGGGTMGAGAGGATVVINVAGSVVSERELVDVVHDGLLRKQARSAGLGFRAA